MTILQFIQSEYISALTGGIGGIATAWFTQRILNKRGTFTYFVNHQRVGMSAEDAIFGSVSVTWNGKPASNLYISTIELKNESMNDFEDIVIRVYTDDTVLMTERTQIIDTPNVLEWSEHYKSELKVEQGGTPTDVQYVIFNGQREYIVYTMNRGQSVRLTYLNSPKSANPPNIWLSVTKKGVKLKFRTPQNSIFGVPQPRAAFAGVVIGIVFVVTIVWRFSDPWIIALSSLAYGLVAQAPGAYAVKLLRRIREAIGG